MLHVGGHVDVRWSSKDDYRFYFESFTLMVKSIKFRDQDYPAVLVYLNFFLAIKRFLKKREISFN